VDPYRQSSVDFSRAIRSIRVAAALNEQYAVLARAKSYSNPDELSRVIGEARQLYPEIWANLDDARNALAERGISVAAYDELRARQATRAGGVLDVQAHDKAYVPIGGGVVKSATMNVEGHALATEACNLMRRALPQVDWDALDRAEADEIAAAGSLRPARWKGVVLSIVGVALCAALVVAYILFRTSLR
jgi:hypothetical protein